MSASVLLIWFLTYYSSIKSTAGFHISIFFLTTALLSSFSESKKLNILACSFSIIIFYISPSSNITVLFSSMAAGLAGFIYYRTSYTFSEETEASVLAVLSVRFYLFFIAIALYLFYTGETAHLTVSLKESGILILLGLMNMVIPVFLSQKSLQMIGVNQFTFLTTLIPTVTFFLDVIFGQVWQSSILVACLCTTITLNFDNVKKLTQFRKGAKADYFPPATSMNAPVTYDASSESNHKITLATSSGVPPRCNGISDFKRSTRLGSPPQE